MLVPNEAQSENMAQPEIFCTFDKICTGEKKRAVALG